MPRKLPSKSFHFVIRGVKMHHCRVQGTSEIRKDAMLVALMAEVKRKFVIANAVQAYEDSGFVASNTHS
jgi:hypothetical protein